MKRTLLYFVLTCLVAVYCVFWQMKNGVKKPESVELSGGAAVENVGAVASSDVEPDDYGDVIASAYPELLYVFPEPDDWRRRHPYVFHSVSNPEDARYFFLCSKEPTFKEQPDGTRLVVPACTFVVLPKARMVKVTGDSGESIMEPESAEARAKRALVVEIDNELSLDIRASLYDFKRFNAMWDPANILGGHIAGNVAVRRGDFYDEENSGEAFRFDTSNVTFTGRQLRTTQGVDIHFGKHTCKGTGLTIDFNLSEELDSILKDKKSSAVAAEGELADQTPREPDVPDNPDDLEYKDSDYLLRIIDQVVNDGNLGGGFSIRSVVLDKLDSVAGLTIYAKKDEKTEEEKRPEEEEKKDAFDYVEISCDGSVQFAPVERNPGEWCLRLANNVKAEAFMEDEGQSVASFNGSSLQLFFKDPILEKLETCKFSEVRNALGKRKPSGSLARLDASVLRVFDENLDDDDENAFSATYAPRSNGGARTFNVRALQFYYNLRTGDGCLLNTLESESVRANLENARPSEFLVSETSADGEELRTSITTPVLFVKISEKDELRFLRTTGSGTLTTNLRVADTDDDKTDESHTAGGHAAAYPQQTFAADDAPAADPQGARRKTKLVPVTVMWENGLSVEPETSAEAVVALNALGGARAESSDSVYRLTTSGAVMCDAKELGRFDAPEMNLWFRLRHDEKKQSEDVAGASETAAEQKNDSGLSYAFHPICVKFSKSDNLNADPLDNVALTSPRGAMEIDESLEILFSDLDASLASAEADVVRSAAQEEKGANFDDLREGSGFFKLTSRRARLFCQLSADAFRQFTDDKKKSAASNGAEKKETGAPVRVTRVELTGGVEFEERGKDGKTTANVSGESLLVDNPQTPAMRMILAGSASQNALCRAKELNLRGRTIVVDVEKNEFSVAGAGNVEIIPKKKPAPADAPAAVQNAAPVSPAAPAATAPGGAFSSLASSGPINVMWSKEMRFDGKTMRFISSPDKTVSVSTNDAMLECAETRLVLRNPVNLLELQYDGEHGPDVDYVECAGAPSRSVRMRFNAPSKKEEAAVGPYSGFYRLECMSIRLYVESQKFIVDNQGRLAATIYSASGGVAGADPSGFSKLSEEDIRQKIQEEADKNARKKAGTYQPSPIEESEKEERRLAEEKERKTPKWVRINASFDAAEGSVKDCAAQIDGRVNALVCDVESPEAIVNFDDSRTWPSDFITFQCNRANFSAAENAGRKEVEFVASDNVSFRSGFVSGYCRKLSYDASKNVATLIGDETAPVKLVRQEYSGAKRETLAEFAQGKINIREKTFEVEDAEVSSGFNPADLKKQIEDSRRSR